MPIAAPAISDCAGLLLDFLDRLRIDQVDVYGSHTGAAIAAELAVLAPERIGRVILDRLSNFSPERRAELLKRYAHPFPPDLDGAYLARVFQFCRDQYIFSPGTTARRRWCRRACRRLRTSTCGWSRC